VALPTSGSRGSGIRPSQPAYASTPTVLPPVWGSPRSPVRWC